MLKKAGIHLIIVCFAIPAAFAQETEDSDEVDFTLPSVTVTAQKREEALQDVPVAVASVDGIKVESLQISNINEVGRISPNLKSYDDGGLLFPMIASRGMWTLDEVPVVGVYVDDVPIFNTNSFPSILADIERIEVLRGPQGTLYGRNTLAGAINVITRPPSNQTSGFASFGYGNLSQIEASAGISAPLVEDRLFARISGKSTLRDGYIENTFLSTDDLLETKQYGGNLRLMYLPSSSHSFTFSSALENKRVKGYAFVGGFGVTGADIDAASRTTPYQVQFNTQGLYETLSSNSAFKIDIETSDLSIKSISSLQYTDITGTDDEFDFLPLDIASRTDFSKTLTTLAEEIRVSSKDSPFRWLAGVFVYDINVEIAQDWAYGLANALFAPTPDAAAQYPHVNNNESEQRFTGFSVFANGDYPLTERLRAIAGVRYEVEKSSADVSRWYTKDGNRNYQYPLLGLIPADFEESATFNAFSPKGGFSFDASEEVLLYGNVARGYRPGGINNYTTGRDETRFEPEFSWNYEMGLKSKLLQRRLKANLTGFYIDYRDQQLYTVLDLTTFDIGRANIGRSTSYGAEVETEWAMAEGVTAIANVGYLKTEITEYSVISQTGDELDNAGNEQGYSPRFNGNLGLEIEKPVNQSITLKATADYQYQTDMYFDAENTIEQKAYGLLNGRFVVSYDNLDVSIWGQNLTDEVYFSYGYGVSGAGSFANYGLPRTIGVALTLRY